MSMSSLVTLEDLAEQYYADGDFTRKRSSYLQSYARILHGRRDAPLSILELGVSSGASLLCWRDYLPNATVVGVDIAEPPARILGEDRIHFVRGSQDDPLTLDKAATIAGGSFDLVVDDASHVGYLTKRSLHYLFPRWLAPGGWYVIEDFGTGFLPEYPDAIPFSPPDWTDAQPGTREFRSSQFGMVGVVKQLIDHTMQDVITASRSYLAIERLMIEANIAFIEKSRTPGGAWPGYIVDAPRTGPVPASGPAGESPAEPRASALTDGLLADLRTSISEQAAVAGDHAAQAREHAARIGELERVVGLLRRGFAPLLWLRRAFRP